MAGEQQVDITNFNEIANAVREESDNMLTRGWTYGTGSKAFNVVIQNKEYIKAVQEQVNLIRGNTEAIKDSNKNSANALELSKENTEAIKENTDSIEENTHKSIDEANKRHKDNKEFYINWKQTSRKVIELMSQLSGFISGRIDRENQLNKVLAESNVIYDGNAKDMADYANKLGMTLDEYGEYLRNNAREFNIMQNTFQNGVQDINMDWKKISAASGATLQESQKGFATYTKMMAQTGQLSQMTASEFNDGAQEFIKEMKNLARATGTNTDTMLKQIEQNEQQYQMQALMNNENTRYGALALQNMGLSPDQIVGVMSGVVSEELATQMAVNPQMREIITQLQSANRNGGLRDEASLRATMQQIQGSRSYQEATARNQAMKNNDTITNIATLSGQGNPYSGIYTSSTIANNINSVAKNLDEGANKKLKDQMEAATGRQIAEKTRDNSAEQMAMLGDHLVNVNNSMAKLAEQETKLYNWLNEYTTKYGALMSQLGIIGSALNRYLPLVEQTIKLTQSTVSIFSAINGWGTSISKWGSTLTQTGGTLTKILGWGAKLVGFLMKASPWLAGIAAVVGILYSNWNKITKWLGWGSSEDEAEKKVAKSKEEIAQEVQEQQAAEQTQQELETTSFENTQSEDTTNYAQMTTNELLTDIARKVGDLVSNQAMNNYVVH